MRRRVIAALLAGACTQPPVIVVPEPVHVVNATAPVVSEVSTPPPVAPPAPVVLPPIATRTLSNGLELMVVEHHELPVAHFVLLVKSGYEEDPARLPGLASMVAGMLDEGAGRRSALQIASQQGMLGASLMAAAGYDATTLALQAPVVHLDSAFALFADVALRPTFASAELERLRADRLTLLTQLEDRAPSVADAAFTAALFGETHPYGRPALGTRASIRAMTRADVAGFFATHFRPGNATLIVVGDVATDDIERRVQRAFGGWRPGPPPSARAEQVSVPAARAITLVDKPGAGQASVRVGTLGAARTTPDYFPLLVMNTVLGGAFGSRLNKNLREQKGYTYGVKSTFEMRAEPGPFIARAEVVAEKTDSALVEFVKELTAIRDTVPVPELERAKRYLQTQLPRDFETPAGIASRLAQLALYRLPLDYYEHFTAHVGAVSQADVQRVARQYIDPARLTIVVVGDRRSLEAPLRSLGLGPLVLAEPRAAAKPVP